MCVHARVPRPLAAQSVLCETHKSTRRVRAPICPACSPAVCPSPPAGPTVPAPPRTWMENPQKAHAPCPAQISTAPTHPAAAPPAAAFPRLGARTMTCARRSRAAFWRAPSSRLRQAGLHGICRHALHDALQACANIGDREHAVRKGRPSTLQTPSLMPFFLPPWQKQLAGL